MPIPTHSPRRRSAAATPTFSSLSHPQQRLVRLLTYTHFGRIHGLRVAGGQPVFDSNLLVIRTVKLCGHCERVRTTGDHAILPAEILALLALLKKVGDGVIDKIEVAHGLPLLADVVEPPPAA